MDFKIGDDIQNDVNNRRGENIIKIIIIAIVALAVGLIVFFICNALFGKKEVKPEPAVSTNLSLTDENVQILYDYVTYGTRGVRNDKFLKEDNVSLEDFTNQERFYYALQFAQVEDFVNTERVNEQNEKIYNISSTKIKNYMQRFFGSKVTYSTNISLNYPFSFRINGMNVGVLTYSTVSDGYDTVFNALEEDITEDKLVDDYYYKLVGATKEPDGSYVLKEKVVYTQLEKNGDNYVVYIYKDHQHTNLIETRQNQTETTLRENPIDIDSYLDTAATITYTFGVDNITLYFDNSKITYE